MRLLLAIKSINTSTSKNNNTSSLSDVITGINNLREDQAMVFKMKTFYKLSTETISQKLNIDSEKVWELLHESRKSLINVL